MREVSNHYHLARELARKYSHSTYLATLTDEPEHQVVLTIFPSSLFHSLHEREKLLQKAQHIKKLQHPHLMPISDIGIEQEQPFVVHEYQPTGSLRNHLKNITSKRLELRQALTIVLQVGEALIYSHKHNVIHGNIKPENILLDTNGKAQLTDFSLFTRKDVLIRDQATEEYAFCYLAPEQLASICDAKSDQYALGCLAYELITGQVPFASQALASLMGNSPNTVPPAAFPKAITDLSPSLESAVFKALAQDPAERFFELSQLLDAIRSVLSPESTFPLLRSTSVRKKRTTSHIAQSAKIEVPIRKHILKADENQHWPVKEQELKQSFAMPQEPASALALPVLEVPIVEEEAHDILHADSFEDERSHGPLALISDAQSDSKASKASPAVAIYTDVPSRKIVQTLRDKKKLIGLVLFFSVISALLTYAFWPSGAFTPDMNLYKSIHINPTANPELALVLAQRDNSAPIPTVAPTPTLIPTPHLAVHPQASPTPALGSKPVPTTVTTGADPYPPSGTLALSDPLVDNSKGYGWDVTPPASSNGGFSCQFTQGAYYAEAQDNIYNNCRPSLKPSNFTFEVQMKIVSGSCGGLTLRDAGNGDAYSYQVCQDGSYQLNRLASSIQTLTSGSSASITTGLNQANLIAAVANGSNFDLYVNHQKVASVNDSAYTGGMCSVTAFNSQVAYNNARIWTL